MALDAAYTLFTTTKEEVHAHLDADVATLRTGRVTPHLVERIPVEHYGSRTPLQGLASVTQSDARTLTISPWDPGSAAAIEKAVTEANLGVQPNVDGNIIRLVFPSLTEEARLQTVKALHKLAEEARVRLRQGRDEALKMMREEKETGELTEDDFYDGKKKLDGQIDAANKAIEELVAKKEQDIITL